MYTDFETKTGDLYIMTVLTGPTVIIHPKSDEEIAGRRLLPSERILPSDMYASSDGTWQPSPFTNDVKLEGGVCTVWVRPSNG